MPTPKQAMRYLFATQLAMRRFRAYSLATPQAALATIDQTTPKRAQALPLNGSTQSKQHECLTDLMGTIGGWLLLLTDGSALGRQLGVELL